MPSKHAPDPFHFLNYHVKVSREIFVRLSLYHELLIKWQGKVNLVGPETLSDSWNRHFLDSLQLLLHVKNLDSRMVDLGSGAGFPGMVMAIAGASDMHLVESDTKKILFLKEVARVTNTHLTLHNDRIENISLENCEVILSRACAPLAQLFSYSLPYVSHETISLFQKGKNYSKEIEEANKDWLFDVTILPSVTDSQGVILKTTNLTKKQERGDGRKKRE